MPKGRHCGSQNGAKIDSKKRCKFKSEKVTSWSRLGAIWGRFPRRLGVKNVDFYVFLKVFVNINVFDKDECPRAIRDQKWSKMRAQMAPTWLPKCIKNRSKNMMDFLIDFEAVLEPPSPGQPPTSSRAGAVEGGRGEAQIPPP